MAMKLSPFRPGVDARVLESMVFGESTFGSMAFAREGEPALFEQVLQIISHGSFPKPGGRDNLTDPQRRQLRDAMILMAHVRERRDMLVSNDERAYIRHERRTQLESLLGTRLMTATEFLQWAKRAPTS